MKVLSIGVASVVAAAMLIPAPSSAEVADPVVGDPLAGGVDVQVLEETLQDDALDLAAVDVSDATVEVEVSGTLASGADLDTTGSLDVRESRLEITFDSTSETFDGEQILLDVVELNEDAVVVEYEDPATGETVRYEEGTGELAAIPLIIGIPIGISLLKALFFATAVVVVAGVTYVIATEAISAIQSRGSTYQHFAAIRRSSGLFIGNGMSLNAAIQRGRASMDTWSRSSSGARAVAYGVNNRTPVGPEIDASGSNKHYHYHPSNRRPAMHAFYGSPR